MPAVFVRSIDVDFCEVVVLEGLWESSDPAALTSMARLERKGGMGDGDLGFTYSKALCTLMNSDIVFRFSVLADGLLFNIFCARGSYSSHCNQPPGSVVISE